MQHRDSTMCLRQENNNQFEYDESDENSSQHHQQMKYTQFSNNNGYNFTQNQHQSLDETQQQADQHTLELRMNNLNNEDIWSITWALTLSE